MMRFSLQLAVELKLFAAHLAVVTALDRMVEQRVHVDGFGAEDKLSAGDAREVKQVINQLGFQLDISSNHVQLAAHAAGKIWLNSQRGHGHQHGRERRAKLMRK